MDSLREAGINAGLLKFIGSKQFGMELVHAD